jgi:beta propeller repeat protein
MAVQVILFGAIRSSRGESAYHVDPAARITLAGSPDNEVSGGLDGSTAAWFNSASGTIYVCDLLDPGSTTRAISTGGKPSHVRISGQHVVWYDYADNNRHVYACDISKSVPAPVRLTSAPSSENMMPSISGDMVVWKDNRVDPGYSDIWGYDLSDPNRGDFLIVEGVKWGMEHTGRPFPAISGDWLVWYQEPMMPSEPFFPADEIKALDLSDPGASPITLDVGYAVGVPHTDGRTVVYNVSRDESNWDVCGVDLSDIAAGPFDISTTSYDELVGDVSGDMVIYGSGEYPGMFRLIDVTDMSEWGFDPGAGSSNAYVSISGDWIMWRQGGDVYANRIVPEPATMGMLTIGALVLLRRRVKRRES